MKPLDLLTDQSPVWLKNFVVLYQQLSTTNLDLLATIYHDDVTFIDPMHQIKGFDNLYDYFQGLYQNLTTCLFVIDDVIEQGDQAAIYWQMRYQHPKLNNGNVVTVFGHSHIKGQDGKVIYHRDYLDLGAMLYEQIPVLGKVTRWIKKRASR